MVILTCANNDLAKDFSGNIFKGFSFKKVISETVRKAELYGYTPVVYDLGKLGIGQPFQVIDQTFTEKGYYEQEVQEGYKSKALFKPEIVKHCLSIYNDLIVYLDGDAQLCAKIDEVKTNDYDVGVTLREPSEFGSVWYQNHFKIAKYVNAGVIFFNPTPATKNFVDNWQKLTQRVGNDQKALNNLTCPDEYPRPNDIITMDDVRIKYFPCKQYNYYLFEEGLVPNIKIMHFKGSVRHFYPFNWKRRVYCRTVIPLLNKVRPLVKKILFYR